MISIVRDITERRKNEEALLKAERRASEEYLELLSRIVPVAQTLGTARDLTSIYRALHEFVRISMPCTAFFVSFYNAEKACEPPHTFGAKKAKLIFPLCRRCL